MPSDNPLWFGYYPGDRPVYKKPDKTLPPTPINPPDLGVNAVLDEAINTAGKPAEMPASLWSWITDDWKQRFLVGTSASVSSGEDLLQFSSQEVSDAKGAYVSINIADLATDPKKTITDFVQKSINTLNPFNALSSFESEFWIDLDTVQEREMWKNLMDPPSKSPLLFDETKKSFGPLEFTKQGVYEDKDIVSPFAGIDPSTGKDKKITILGSDSKTAEGGVDVYENVKSGTLEFVIKKKTGLFRNGGYRKMQDSFIKAATTEFTVKEIDINAALAADPTIDLEVGTRLNAFKEEGQLANTLSKFNEKMSDVQDAVVKSGIKGPVKLTEVQEALDSLKGSTKSITASIEKTRSAYGPLSGERDKFNRDIKELENYINDVNNIAAKYSAVTSMGRLTGAENMLSEVQQLRNRFANARYSGGTYDRFLENFGRRHFEGDKSVLKLDLKKPGTSDPIFSNGLRSISTVYEVQKRAYWQESGREISSLLAKGNFSKNYFWFGSTDVTIGGKTIPIGAIRERIQLFTPGYWTGQIVERTHKFGLVYDEKIAEKGGVLHKVFERNPLISKHVFTEKFTANGVKLSAKLEGSKNLGTFYNAWDSAKKGQLIGSYNPATLKVLEFGDHKQNMQGFFDLLNDPSKSAYLKNATMGYLGSNKDWKSLNDNFQEIRDALLKNNKLGLHLDSAGNILNDDYNKNILTALFKNIGDRKAGAAYISPFVSKVGVLQVYASKISQAQTWMFTKLGVDKLIAPFVRFKALLAQKVAGVLLKFGGGALSAATGGLAVFIIPIAEKLLHLVSAKIIDSFKDLTKAILKGNFSDAFDKMMNDSMKAMQKVITCGCLVPIVFGFGIFLLMGTVLTSVSPVEKIKDSASSADSTVTTAFTKPGDTVAGTNCPLKSATITLGSYTPNALSHGSKTYWTTTFGGGRSKMFSIPFLGPGSFACSTTTQNNCSPKETSPYGVESPIQLFLPGDLAKLPQKSTEYYGFAADYRGGDNVYAPNKITCGSDDAVSSWTNTTGVKTKFGCGIVMEGNSSGHQYKILLLHINYCSVGSQDCSCYTGKTYDAGEGITTLWPNNKHIHIELLQDTIPQRPESCVCK